MSRLFPALVVGAACLPFVVACPKSVAVGREPAPAEPVGEGTPAAALQSLIAAATAGDEQAFREGLSRDFIATVGRYQEMAHTRGELRGAFDWPVFMRSLARSRPQPREEWVRGDKATVKALHGDGREVQTELVREEGRWKLAVPPGMVTDLDHFEEVEQKLRAPADAGPAVGEATASPAP